MGDLSALNQATIEYFLAHRFAVLGSGWVRVYHGMECRGLDGYRYGKGAAVTIDGQGKWLEGRINASNIAEAKRIWKLVDADYVPIDWHIDFKCGYRWCAQMWYKDIKYGHKVGVDVKVPWELSRMQHLPQMAAAFYSSKDSAERKRLEREFRNQVLDFISGNPPGFGVNWRCSMDVGIRAVNWLIAYDTLCASGSQLDDDFNQVFVRSVYEHGLHITKNLEWYNRIRNNHYLANISGLAFISAYLPPTTETNAWLAFAVQELVNEVNHQFYADGGNFEGSTAYHCLATEMVYFATALVLGLSEDRFERLRHYDCRMLNLGFGKPRLSPAPLPFFRLPPDANSPAAESPFPPWYYERMERMVKFLMDMTKPNGRIPQIGDNDSGRLLKLDLEYEHITVKEAKEKYTNLAGYSELADNADFFVEKQLDCRHLVAAAYALFGREEFALRLGGESGASRMWNCVIIRALSHNSTVISQCVPQRQRENNTFCAIGRKEDFQKAISELKAKRATDARKREYLVQSGDLRECLTMHAYPHFGLYLYTSPCLYLAIRCWPHYIDAAAGHLHNDQLAIELVIEGQELIKDCGTYIYTALPEIRNYYRSIYSHDTPWPANAHEPAGLNVGLFRLSVPRSTQHIVFDRSGFFGTFEAHGRSVARAVVIESERVVVYDSHCGTGSVLALPPYSPAYGVQERRM